MSPQKNQDPEWVNNPPLDANRNLLEQWEERALQAPDQEEFDLTVDYRFKKGLFERLWLRFRGAVLNQHGPNAHDTVDFRIILNYDLPIL